MAALKLINKISRPNVHKCFLICVSLEHAKCCYNVRCYFFMYYYFYVLFIKALFKFYLFIWQFLPFIYYNLD